MDYRNTILFLINSLVKNTFNLICFLEYIPDFTDIEKSSANFLKESTIGSLMYGDSSRNTAKAKIYRNPSYPGFVRVENVVNHQEYIFAYDEDRNLLKEGIYRYSYSSGTTSLGNRLFRRDGRKENRLNRLSITSSGNIYYSRLMEKSSTDWKTLAEYKFNPGNLTWTKEI